MNYAIETQHLTKKYPKFVLDNINLSIPSGIVVGMIGENGAGKTTLIKSLLNIVRKDQGTIRLLGHDMGAEETLAKDQIGVVLDNAFFPEGMRVEETARILKQSYANWDDELFYRYLAQFGVDEKKDIKSLSKGTKKKVEIACALAHHPKLLILDELTSGLDPIVRHEVLDIFRDFIRDEEHTILLSTHITTDLEQIADHIVFIDRGHKVLDISREDLFEQYGILKCAIQDFEAIDTHDYVSYIKEKYEATMLVNEINQLRTKYPNAVVEPVTLESLMLLMIKGEKTI